MISIIIPVYNEIRFLDYTIESVLNQDFQDIELILVDDGSNNGAEAICDRWAMIDRRIKTIHKKNGGLSSARLTGLNNSTGEWLMFMDHDDILMPNCLNKLSRFTKNDSLDIIAGGRIDSFEPTNNIFEEEEKFEYFIEKGANVVEMIPDDRNQEIIIIPLWGKLYRRTYLDRINLKEFQEKCPTIFFEDVLMTPILYYKARNICILKTPCYIHREVPTSISRSGKLSSFYFEQIISGEILLEFSKLNNLQCYYRMQLGNYFRTLLRIYCLNEYYLDTENSKKYELLIRGKLAKYKKEFQQYGEANIFYKLAFILYEFNPILLKYTSKIFYFFKKYSR